MCIYMFVYPLFLCSLSICTRGFCPLLHKNRRTPSLRYFSVNRTPMAVWTGASYLVWLSSPKIVFSAQAASLIHRRCLAGGGGNMSFLSFFRPCLLAEENKPGKENKSGTLFSLYKKSCLYKKSWQLTNVSQLYSSFFFRWSWGLYEFDTWNSKLTDFSASIWDLECIVLFFWLFYLVNIYCLKHIADHHGPPKVNFWPDPMHPSRWKKNTYVIPSQWTCFINI